MSNSPVEYARQGDVMLIRVDQLPNGLSPTKRDEHDRIVLAHGELSGHAHTLRGIHTTGFSFQGADGEVDFIEVGGSGDHLNHEYVSGKKAEHDAVFVKGFYRVERQREGRRQAIQRAAD